MFGLYDYFFFAVFAGFIALDFIAPAREFVKVPHWRVKGLISAAMYFFIAGYAPFLWDGWLGQHRIVDATSLPLWIAAPLAFATYELGIYVWHRTMHATPFLWRHLHQTHHSAERVDIWGALYFHPLDMTAFTFVGSLTLTLALGVAPEAVLLAFLLATFLAFFQHANIRTPRWLGYFIVRPESHALHHERGVHRYNYSDLPLWDMIFGTFRNPKTWEGEAGLIDGGSSAYLDLLIGRDITRRAHPARGTDRALNESAPEGAQT